MSPVQTWHEFTRHHISIKQGVALFLSANWVPGCPPPLSLSANSPAPLPPCWFSSLFSSPFCLVFFHVPIWNLSLSIVCLHSTLHVWLRLPVYWKRFLLVSAFPLRKCEAPMPLKSLLAVRTCQSLFFFFSQGPLSRCKSCGLTAFGDKFGSEPV